MNIFSINQPEIKPAQDVIFRNIPYCVFWAILLAVAAVICAAGGVSEIGLAGLLVFVYTLQALAAEVLGVRVSSHSISAPRRLGFLPMPLVLWRTEDSLETIESVVSISNNCARLKWLTGVCTILIFPDRDQKHKFFQLVRQLEPSIDLRKGR
jgi:hypothetical protein